jgi:hypothetical protein
VGIATDVVKVGFGSNKVGVATSTICNNFEEEIYIETNCGNLIYLHFHKVCMFVWP